VVIFYNPVENSFKKTPQYSLKSYKDALELDRNRNPVR